MGYFPASPFLGHNDMSARNSLRFCLVWRSVGYLLSAIAASLIYVCWLFTEITSARANVARSVFDLGLSLVIWLTGGFSAALVLMVFPWIIAVSAYRRLRWSSRIYFPVVGAVLVFVIGCATTSVSPKPLWIEDQTFFEGARIAALRQGASFFVSGVVFGAVYWFLCERGQERLSTAGTEPGAAM